MYIMGLFGSLHIPWLGFHNAAHACLVRWAALFPGLPKPILYDFGGFLGTPDSVISA
jgi:hypothetical protein